MIIEFLKMKAQLNPLLKANMRLTPVILCFITISRMHLAAMFFCVGRFLGWPIKVRWDIRIDMKPHATIPYTAFPAYSDAERIAKAKAAYDHIKTRRSCRHFSADSVPREVIEYALLAAGTAPNGANHQPWHFAVIESAAKKKALRQAAEAEEHAFYEGKASDEWLEALAPLGTDGDKPYLEHAPYLIIIFAQRKGGMNPGDTKKNYYVNESVGIAAGMLISALHDAGLATLTHTPNPMTFLNKICGRPSDEKPMMVLVVGKPATGATIPVHATRKKPLDQISSWL
jgi:iodotyrosine deiodinase